MKKVIIILLIILAVVLILLIIGIWYAYQTLSPFLISEPITDTNQSATSDNQPITDKHPLLTPAQEATLEKIGIDPAKLPTTITPEMETCFIEKLGSDRVAEIKAGASPNPLDFFKAKSCL